MKLVTARETRQRKPRSGNAPTISVYFGAEGDSPDLGVLRITVPANGGGMAPHKHNGSDIVVVPLVGSVVIAKDGESVEVGVGDAIQILRDEAVSLTNPADSDAEVLVCAGPAAFVRDGVLNMPEA